MRIQISNGCYLNGPIQAHKKLNIQVEKIRNNTLVFGMLELNDGNNYSVCIKSDLYAEGYYQTFEQPGAYHLMGLLKFNRIISIAPRGTYNVRVGVLTGTGVDFAGALATNLRVVFTKDTQSSIPERYRPTSNGYEFGFDNIIDNGNAKGYFLNIGDVGEIGGANWDGVLDKHAAVQFSIKKDSTGKVMLEESVQLHIYDHNGTLLGVINKENYQEDEPLCVAYNASTKNIYVLAVIKPTGSGTFAIGDPRTDARVKVTEEDV